MGFTTNLPHCQLCEELSATDYVERLMANPGDEVYIAVSHDFYDENNYGLHESDLPPIQRALPENCERHLGRYR